MGLNPEHQKQIEDRFAEDPFGDETMKYRRNVLAFSLVCIMVEIFDVQVKDMPYIAVESISEPFLVKGMLSIVLVYQYLVFLCYCWVDFRRWYFYPNLLVAGDYFGNIAKLHNMFGSLVLNIEKIQNLEIRSDLADFWNKAIASVREMERDLRTIHRKFTVVTYSQWFRIAVFDVAVPLGLGLLAVILLRDYPIQMVMEVFRSIVN